MVNKWANKQLWRIKATWVVASPIVALIQLILYVVIAIGINDWFELTFESFALIILISLVSLNLIGFALDKTGFLQEHKMREFIIQSPKIYKAQAHYGQALVAKFMRMTDEEIEKVILDNAKELGIDEE